MESETQIPIIDLSEINGHKHAQIVEEVRHATREWGFFQVVNHGIPVGVLDEMLKNVRFFFENDREIEAAEYMLDGHQKVQYISMESLGVTDYLTWKETLMLAMTPHPPSPDELPSSCREIAFEYIKHIDQLAETLFHLLSESLGLNADHLSKLECHSGIRVACHYYPPCPQPETTLGTTDHTDPCFLTLLLQDYVGGLQIKRGDQYIDVHPVHGALVVNTGDLLQLISNDIMKSVVHRVLANATKSRLSIACLIDARESKVVYGPIKELISDGSKPVYKKTTAAGYIEHIYFNLRRDYSSGLDAFKLDH